MLERVGPARIEVLQQVGPAADRADREPAADQLCHHGEVGVDPGGRLRPADAEAQRHDLVEHEHRAGGAGRGGNVGEEARAAA